MSVRHTQHGAAQPTDISPQNWIAMFYGAVLCGSQTAVMAVERFSMGPVHGEGYRAREKKSKCDVSSVWGVRVSTGSFVWL